MKLLLLLLKTPALKTGLTMLLSLVGYAFIFGWAYAVGFVVLIFCHEMGHFMAARQLGEEPASPRSYDQT